MGSYEESALKAEKLAEYAESQGNTKAVASAKEIARLFRKIP